MVLPVQTFGAQLRPKRRGGSLTSPRNQRQGGTQPANVDARALASSSVDSVMILGMTIGRGDGRRQLG
jgi:hypothetical protein